MNAPPQEQAEPERREGFGGRVRRFIDNELSGALDKDDSAAEPAPATPGDEPATAPAEQQAPTETGDRRSERAATRMRKG